MLKKIIIAFDSSGYGGAGESLFTLVKNLKDTYNFTVALPGYGQLADKLRNIGVQVDYVRNESWRWWVNAKINRFKFLLTFLLQLISLLKWMYYLKKTSPDIVHCNTSRLIVLVFS